jgi:hypothetical protein
MTILCLDGAPFGSPILAFEGADLQELFVVLDLILCVQPMFVNNIVVRLEDMNKSCRRGWGATDDSVEKVDFFGRESCEFSC